MSPQRALLDDASLGIYIHTHGRTSSRSTDHQRTHADRYPLSIAGAGRNTCRTLRLRTRTLRRLYPLVRRVETVNCKIRGLNTHRTKDPRIVGDTDSGIRVCSYLLLRCSFAKLRFLYWVWSVEILLFVLFGFVEVLNCVTLICVNIRNNLLQNKKYLEYSRIFTQKQSQWLYSQNFACCILYDNTVFIKRIQIINWILNFMNTFQNYCNQSFCKTFLLYCI